MEAASNTPRPGGWQQRTTATLTFMSLRKGLRSKLGWLLASGLIIGASASEAPRYLESIQQAELVRDVSFLASDELQGRDTPSPGLEAAAAYIASSFRAAGLEPAAEGYFQRVEMRRVLTRVPGAELVIRAPGQMARLGGESFRMTAGGILPQGELPVFKADGSTINGLTPATVAGSVVAVAAGRGLEARRLRLKIRSLRPVAILVIGPIDPRADEAVISEAGPPAKGPVTLLVSDPEVEKLLEAAPSGLTNLRATFRLPPAAGEEFESKNVAGILRGSDPQLAATYVVVSAHYDHIGVSAKREGDRINNGANDDASGVAAMLAAARALASAPNRPRRSILFLAFCGEEKGLLGSEWYGHHPLVPLAATVAQLNLEQLGRTDADGNDETGKLYVTGYDFTDIPSILATPAGMAGIELAHNPSNSDAFFDRSDNAALARHGIPAHTLSTGYEFSDYHQPGDHWDKLNYPHLVKAARAVAYSAAVLADREEAPQWNRNTPKTEKYRRAAEALSK